VLAGNSSAKFARVGIQDRFGQSGKPNELFKAYGLTAENIAEQCRKLKK
jgi:transketolase